MVVEKSTILPAVIETRVEFKDPEIPTLGIFCFFKLTYFAGNTPEDEHHINIRVELPKWLDLPYPNPITTGRITILPPSKCEVFEYDLVEGYSQDLVGKIAQIIWDNAFNDKVNANFHFKWADICTNYAEITTAYGEAMDIWEKVHNGVYDMIDEVGTLWTE